MGYRTTKSKIEAGSNKVKTFDSINATANISYTTFFYHAFRNILLASVPLLAISALALSSLHSSATGSGTDQIQFSLSSSCTMSSVVDSAHTKEITNGTYHSDVGKTTITTLCNDVNGYSIYAVGYSNDEEGNNQLINTVNSNFNIDTGLATSGLTSDWAMSLNNVVNDTSPTPPEIEDDYDGVYGLVPTEWTKVASRPSGTTDMDEGSSFTTTYAIYTTSNQHAGTYNGQVKYLLTHPATTSTQLFMQDVVAIKNNLPNVGDSMQAVDKRDGKKYWVTRLADGNVWMTQNLDFDIVADEQNPTKMKTLTSEDTDLTGYSLTGAYSQANGYSYDENTGIISWTPATTAKTINFEGTKVTSWQDSNTEPHSANKTDDTNTGHASSGNWYDWTAAIASNDSSSLTSDTINDISQNPQNSICPKGWRLPTISSQSETIAGSTNEFARLNYLYNNNLSNTDAGLIIAPLWFRAIGTVTNYQLWGYSTAGSGWTSSVYSDTSAYYYVYNSSDAHNTTAPKQGGKSVRCLAR